MTHKKHENRIAVYQEVHLFNVPDSTGVGRFTKVYGRRKVNTSYDACIVVTVVSKRAGQLEAAFFIDVVKKATGIHSLIYCRVRIPMELVFMVRRMKKPALPILPDVQG